MTPEWTFSGLDRRVQRCHDERRDPLDDPEVVASLEADPERLAAFAAERQAVAALAHRHAPPPAARRPRQLVRHGAALGAAALLASLAAALLRGHHVDLDPASTPRIVSAELQQLRAPAGLAVSFCESHVLVASPGSRLETFTYHTTTR